MHVDVQEAISTVLAVRSFRDEPVPDEVLRDILEAGRLSASASNKQPWNFVVVQDRAMLRKLGSLTSNGPYIAGAPLAIAVTIETKPLTISDASRAIQNMVLAAWSHGVGSNWVGFSGMLDAMNPVLGVPDGLDIVAVIPFGYPAASTGKGIKKRKPLAEIVHWETWGEHTSS